jgi:hypothetical protein
MGSSCQYQRYDFALALVNESQVGACLQHVRHATTAARD